MSNGPTETYELQWAVYVAAKNKERAMLTMQRLQEVIRLPIQIGKVSPYWRDSSLYEVLFTTPYFETTRANAVYQSLLIADTIAWEWQIRSPKMLEGEFDFGGISTKTKIIGLTWVSFDLILINSNYLINNQLLLEGSE